MNDYEFYLTRIVVDECEYRFKKSSRRVITINEFRSKFIGKPR